MSKYVEHNTGVPLNMLFAREPQGTMGFELESYW